MPLSRRHFIRIAGSTAVILAAGTGTFALTREPSRALAPWAAAGVGYDDPRLRALSWAILAPNPHNRQPWLADLQGDDSATLYCDPERRLPETDPFDRQIVIGLGCFLEILRLAAAEDGYRVDMIPFPEGSGLDRVDERPVARLRFVADDSVAKDPLFAQVPQRRTNKEPFDTERPVSVADLSALKAVVGDGIRVAASNDPASVAALRDLSWRAHVVETETPRTLQESVDLMRTGKSEIEANPDGIDLGGAFLEALNIAGVMTREKIADPATTAYAEGLKMYHAILHTAMAHVWLVTDGNARTDQLAAGAAWVRLNLKATELGLGIHPVSQALQEYAEMTDLSAEMHRALDAGPGQRVQMFGRLGYGPELKPSPRWPLETRLRNT